MNKKQLIITDLSGGLHTQLSSFKIPDNCLVEAENARLEDGILRSKKNARLMLDLVNPEEEAGTEHHYYYNAFDGYPSYPPWVHLYEDNPWLIYGLLAFYFNDSSLTDENYYQAEVGNRSKIEIDFTCKPSKYTYVFPYVVSASSGEPMGALKIYLTNGKVFNLYFQSFPWSERSQNFRKWKVCAEEPADTFWKSIMDLGSLDEKEKQDFPLKTFHIIAEQTQKLEVTVTDLNNNPLKWTSTEIIDSAISKIEFGAQDRKHWDSPCFYVQSLNWYWSQSGAVTLIPNILSLYKYGDEFLAHADRFLFTINEGKYTQLRNDMNVNYPSQFITYLDKLYLTTNYGDKGQLMYWHEGEWFPINALADWRQPPVYEKGIVKADLLILHRDRLFIALRGQNDYYYSELFDTEGNAIQPSSPEAWVDAGIQWESVPLPIKRLVSLSDRVVICCDDQFYILYTADNNPVNWTQEKGVEGMGEIAPESFKLIAGGFLFCSENGVYASDGIRLTRLFEQTRDIIEEAWNNGWDLSPVLDEWNDNLILSLPMRLPIYSHEAKEREKIQET